jgi:hypothetical protein
VLTVATSSSAVAYLQDRELEVALRRSDPTALALFPAKGFRDGAAGFFKAHDLYVVPESEGARCQERARAQPPGCYVEFVFQARGLKARTSQGDFCGAIGRWYRVPNTQLYVPTPEAYFSKAVASDEGELVDLVIHEQIRPACRDGLFDQHRDGVARRKPM